MTCQYKVYGLSWNALEGTSREKNLELIKFKLLL